jgi:hypothetical protein
MKFAKKSDIAVVGILAAAGILLWVLSSASGGYGTTAEIYYKSELVKRIDLSSGKDESFSVDGLPNVVFHQYADGSSSFVQSDCPDKICIKSGRLRLVGQMAACLPNQVYVKITGKGPHPEDRPDIVIG